MQLYRAVAAEIRGSHKDLLQAICGRILQHVSWVVIIPDGVTFLQEWRLSSHINLALNQPHLVWPGGEGNPSTAIFLGCLFFSVLQRVPILIFRNGYEYFLKCFL